VIVGKATRLKTEWIKRDPLKIYDPWRNESGLVVNELVELGE